MIPFKALLLVKQGISWSSVLGILCLFKFCITRILEFGLLKTSGAFEDCNLIPCRARDVLNFAFLQFGSVSSTGRFGAWNLGVGISFSVLLVHSTVLRC